MRPLLQSDGRRDVFAAIAKGLVRIQPGAVPVRREQPVEPGSPSRLQIDGDAADKHPFWRSSEHRLRKEDRCRRLHGYKWSGTGESAELQFVPGLRRQQDQSGAESEVAYRTHPVR